MALGLELGTRLDPPLAAPSSPSKRVELITLDREIGDGDHGENLDRGFQAVVAEARRSGRRRDARATP